MTSGRYIFALLGVTALLLLAAAGTVYVVDPYGVTNAPTIDGFNSLKPRSYTHVWAAKTARAEGVKADTVILGNSRADVGLDPRSPGWSEGAGIVYNFGIPGVGPDGMARAYVLQMAANTPERLYVGLDFMDFLSDVRASVIPADLPDVEGGRDWQDVAQLYLSQVAVIDAVKTVAAQGGENTTTMTPHGFNTLAGYNDIIRTEGHFSVARQRNQENLKAYANRPRQILFPDGEETDSLRSLRTLIEDAAGQGIEIVFFTYPYHGDLMETIDRTGFWPLLEDWKRLMVTVLSDYRSQYGEVIGPLWDFTEYNSYTTEPIPPAGDRKTRMEWYWEPGHFKAALGDIMIRRMNGAGPNDFGQIITPDNVVHVIAEERAAKTYYAGARPGSRARIAALCDAMDIKCVRSDAGTAFQGSGSGSSALAP